LELAERAVGLWERAKPATWKLGLADTSLLTVTSVVTAAPVAD
jgi:hypothetical protein